MSPCLFSKTLRPVVSAAIWLLLMAAPALAQTVTLSLPSKYAVVPLGQTQQFTATIHSSGSSAVWWLVNGVKGGSPESGTISDAGLYTAPAIAPVPAAVRVTVMSQANPAVSASAMITLATQPALGSVYYVSLKGRDTNPGTLSLPWRTIQHAANSVAAGDTVYVRKGIYHEVVTIPVSGSDSRGFITFSNYPGETVTLDGTSLKVPNGQWGLFTLQDESYVVINGFEIRNYSTSSTAYVPIGIYVAGSGSNLQLLNNHIHNIRTLARGCAANALGVAVYGSEAPASLNGIVIGDNEIDHLTLGCSESLSLAGNVENFLVTGNRIHDNNNIGIDASGFYGFAPDPAYDQARNGIIRGNTVFNITSYANSAYGSHQYAADGIYVDGGMQILVEQNLIHNVDLGIELASENAGRETSYVTARNNIVYSDYSNGISIGGYDSSVGGTSHCTIVNNTLFQNDARNTGSGEFQIQYHATNNVFENNLIYAGRQALFVNAFAPTPDAPAALGYNLYYSTVGAVRGNWTWQGADYQGYTTYLAATGLDVHSLFANPQLVRAPTNLDVKAISPAVNAGFDLGEAILGSADFNGNPRTVGGTATLGAFEQ